MATMNKYRHIRINGVRNNVNGYKVHVTDADTGEAIDKVTRIVVTLEVGALNQAEVTYYESDESGHLIKINGDVSQKVVTVADPEIDVSAIEVLPVETDKQ